MRRRRQEQWIGLLLALGSIAWYLSYARGFLGPSALNDEGFAFYGSLRVLQGQRPLTDFWSYPPGRYWLMAAALHVFGVHLFVERALLAVMLGLKNALAYHVARRVMPRGLAIAATLTLALLPGPWHKVYYSLLLFAQLAVLLKYLDRPTALRAAGCGLIAGLACYFRQDSAAYGLAACAVMVSVVTLRRRQCKTWLVHGFTVLGAFAVSVAPMLAYYAHALPEALRALGPEPVRVAEVIYERIHFMGPVRLGRFFAAHVRDWPNVIFLNRFLPWMAMLLGAAGVASAILRLAGRPGRRRLDLVWTALVVWSVLSLVKVYKQPNLEAVLMAGQGTVLIGFALAWRLWRQRRWLAGALVWLPGGFTWAHLLVMAFVPIRGVESGAICESFGHTQWLRVHRASLKLDAQQARSLTALIDYVQSHTTPQQTIYAWQQPMLYVLCERDNAAATDNVVPPIVLDRWREHLMAVFTERPPAMQILDARPGWTRRLAAYDPALQRAMFRGYHIAAQFDGYLVLAYTGEADAYDAVMQRVGAAGNQAATGLAGELARPTQSKLRG